MEVTKKLIETLRKSCKEVRLQGSLLPNEAYPNEFFTYWNYPSESESYYDNHETAIIYDYSVNFYSTDPEQVYKKIAEAKANLIKNGFIVSGNGYSVSSDETTHTGRGIKVLFRKEIGGIKNV